jgi:hypothetical protein
MQRLKTSFLLLAVVLLSFYARGQAARSPFSALGFGDYYGDAFVNNQGMGGAGVANPQFWHLNNMNPALLVYNRLTVFQAGMVGDNKKIASGAEQGTSRNANLNFLALGFPMMRRKLTGEIAWASAFGVAPYSHVNYDFQYSEKVNGLDVIYSDKARGGFSQFYLSNGVRLFNNFNVGLKTAVLFSSVLSDYSNILSDPTQVDARYVISVREVQSIQGLKFTPGVFYRIDSIAKKFTLNIGATYEMKSSLTSTLEQILERKDFESGAILQSDTLRAQANAVRFPERLTLGFSFGRSDRWMLATDYTFIKPGGSTAVFGIDRAPVRDGWKAVMGFELTPDSRSLSSYLKRVTYRTGASFEHGTYLLNGNTVKDFGINFGLSFPVNRFSNLDVAFRTGKRGDKNLNGIEENYFKIYFGVTFNDQWFIKRKFD